MDDNENNRENKIFKWFVQKAKKIIRVIKNWFKGRFVCSTESTWTFRVQKKELKFFIKTNKYHISPEILTIYYSNIDLMDYPYVAELTVRRYSFSLKQLPFQKQMYFVPKVVQLISDLHNICGIYHCDLHLGNIIVDVNSEDVRLIDFEDSVLINEVITRKKKVYGHVTKNASFEDICFWEKTEFIRQIQRRSAFDKT